MAGENRPIGGPGETDEVKRKALLRLGVAAAVTVAALAGLWWLDQGSKPAKPVPAAVPNPIVAAPAQESAPPQAEEPAAGQATPAEQTVAAAPPATSPATGPAASEPPPPPKVSNTPRTPPPPLPPRRLPATPVPAAHLAVAPATVPAETPPPPSANEVGKGFVLQLGVFSNPDRARELVNKLTKQGIKAHMETRVQLGPFGDRQEAEKAQAEMRKLGIAALIIPASPMK